MPVPWLIIITILTTCQVENILILQREFRCDHCDKNHSNANFANLFQYPSCGGFSNSYSKLSRGENK